MSEEKYYRVKTKDGAHINEKLKGDGSRAAIQFDEENGLQGPVDLIEVDRDDLIEERVVYVEHKPQERSFGRVILENAVAPAMESALTIALARVIEPSIDVFINWMSQKVIPAAKAKGGELIDKAKESYAIKKAKKAEQKQTEMTEKKQTKVATPPQQNAGGDTVAHTQEEVDQIFNNMKFAALYIAAGIRELSNTVIVDDGSDPERSLAMQEKLKELTSEQVMNTIKFMLEDRNRDTLDQATIQLFEAFRHKDFIIEGEAVPISKYLTTTVEK